MDSHQRKEGWQYEGQSPFEDWQINFTHMPKSGGWRYLLVFVYTFSGWVEAYLTRRRKTFEIVNALLKDIIPRFGFLTAYKMIMGLLSFLKSHKSQ